ncbi:MAG: tRNA (N6-isopentenyl adenosine(37)-C2)-methylthiotransferase MiaB, partial [Clostridiales bacterium]|nr:tRNA (N6-isopentenyl adenosine(37)-C2)-methylthiotransferase MiaB [Clostridiales bacterium]
QKLFGHLGEMKKLKTSGSGLVVAVCGCMMQQDGMAAKIKKSYPYADIVFGSNSMHLLPKLLHGVLTEHKRQIDVQENAGDIVEGMPVVREKSAQASVPVMHGCNNFCTYCIVPYVRGRERSRNPEDIINEIELLANKGIKEIILLGQNVNSYDGGISFAQLLRKVGECDKIERVRFMTSHPKDFGQDLIEAIRDTKKVCNHLHLPIQSGSSSVLEKMNRHYTKDDYIGMLVKAKEMVPGIGLSTDIIVGFPGETEEDFLETLDVLEKVRFDFAYTFLYSKRQGTPAAEIIDDVSDKIKHDRFNRLLEVQNRITLEQNLLLIGKEKTVMVVGTSKTDSGVLTGRTESNQIVNFKASGGQPGSFAKVYISDAKTWHLEGEFIKWK